MDGIANANGRNVQVTFLLDGGAAYSCLPERAWRELGLEPRRTMQISLFDGSRRERQVGECLLQFEFGEVTSPVVLGEGADLAMLGSVTLAELGLVLDPFTREIVPMQMTLKAAALVRSG